MTSKQLVNHLCYEYGTTNYNEERLKATQELKKDLERKEQLEKAFYALSKDDEKTKKLLSLEIEKNRKLQIIEEKFNIEVFEMKDLDGKPEYIIDITPKPNLHSIGHGNSLTKEEYEALNKDNFE